MWSIYDTMILITGLITLVIVILPVVGIPAATRLWAGVIGGGLVLLSLLLGNLRWFRYPTFVFVAPVLALLAVGGVVADARKRSDPNQAQLPHDQAASGALPSADESPVQPDESLAAPGRAEVTVGTSSDSSEPMPADGRLLAWSEVNDRSTSAERLAEIAGEYPEFGPRMLDHPNVYPALAEWIRQLPA